MSRAAIKMEQVFEEATRHWKYVAPLLAYPKNESDYNLLVKRLDKLLDIVGEDENHPLLSLVDALSSMILDYEDQHVKFPKVSGVKALKYLMELHQLKQADFSELGSQGVVSEILSGKRKLNLRQITMLAKLFKVSPVTFMDE